MRSLLVIHNPAPAGKAAFSSGEAGSPEDALRAYGYFVAATGDKDKAAAMAMDAEAAVLRMPVSAIADWSGYLLRKKPLPLLWWCDEEDASRSLEACEDDVRIDGILMPSMSERECHWALHFGNKQFMERRQWQSEREQLLGRIEERKWIDMAKSILCEIKNVSESEAYDLLRRQAMNERKRMVDVATSIVKVYQLLQENKQKGAKRK